MSGMFGMNIEQIRALSGQLDSAGHEVETILSNLTKGLATTPWVGKDRDRFEHEWQTAHTAGLRNASQALHHAAQGAKQSADEQHRASDR